MFDVIFKDSRTEKLLFKVCRKYKYAYASGSFALNYLGYIKSPIGDIDICIPTVHMMSGVQFFNRLKYGIFSIFYKEKPISNYLKMIIWGVKVCVFFVDNTKCLEVEYKNKKIKISHPEDVIEAKESYLNKHKRAYFANSIIITMDKHRDDVEQYKKK